MVRVRKVDRHIRRAKIFALTKGFRGRSKNCYSIAVRAAHKALQHAYRSRKQLKRDMRALWITRINNAAQEQKMPYAMFMHNMVRLEIPLNRKILSELAIYEPRSFQALADLARQRQSDGLLSALK